MDSGLIDRIESSAERLASALFGGAVGYAAYEALGGFVSLPELAVCAGAAAIAAHLLCVRVLSVFGREGPRFKVRTFDVREIETLESGDELVLTEEDRISDELVLTPADRLQSPDELILSDEDRLLVLDDVLAELGSDSRVVRLFDRKAMPTPGLLKTRIDEHLGQASPASDADASQALSDALAELRRSLR